MANQSAPSPFFARSYGGFSPEQIAFLRSVVAEYSPGILLDPMAGQARDLGRLAMEGHQVVIEDINPACLCLAALRAPQLVMNAEQLVSTYLQKLSTIHCFAVSETEFACDDWITPSAQQFIGEYRQLFNIDCKLTPFGEGAAFWMGDPSIVFSTAMLVLAARQFVCHRASKNTTWVKKGGIIPQVDLRNLLRDFAESWRDYSLGGDNSLSLCRLGELTISTAVSDWTLGGAKEQPVIKGVITSPPYANRLDYAVMWAPELTVLCELFGEDRDKIKRAQIGTTVVRGMKADGVSANLPPSALQFLDEVASGKAKASDSYYLPFFKNYLLSLSRKIVSAAQLVEKGGFLVCFIRDCVRKDAKLDAERFLAELLGASGFSYVEAGGAKKLIIRNHVGLRRPVDKGALHGTAQTEWHLHFRKV